MYEKQDQILILKTEPGGNFLRLFFLFILLPVLSFPQVKTNLDIFYTLIDSSVYKISRELPERNIRLQINSGSGYSIFDTRVISGFKASGKAIDSTGRKVIFVVDNSSLKYNEMFRDGFLGSYMLPRTLTLQGNYYIDGGNVKQFSVEHTDTIHVDDIKMVENEMIPITRGEVPPEPFFSGLFEPVVAIGTAAVVVYMFFTIRSK